MPLLLASRRSGAHRQPGSYNHVLCCTRDRDPASFTWGEQEFKKKIIEQRKRTRSTGRLGRTSHISHSDATTVLGLAGPLGSRVEFLSIRRLRGFLHVERQRSAIPSLTELLHPRSWHSRDIRPPLEPGAALAPWGGGRGGLQQPRPCSRSGTSGGGGWASTSRGPSALPVHSRRDCAALPTW